MISLGIYEKALPKKATWEETLRQVTQLGFNFYEFSIDESDERLARLDWSLSEAKQLADAMRQTKVPIYTLMLSGHRRYPLGSKDPAVRQKALEMMQKAVDLASYLGIRNIQMAGYDVFYEPKTALSHAYYLENLQKCVDMAAQKQVILAIETMDDSFINSLDKIAQIKETIKSPWLQAYPDFGNLSAWPQNDVVTQLRTHFEQIVAVHLKDTLAVTPDFAGKFKDVDFGRGCVDFEGCLKTMADLGYHGTYTIEMWSQTQPDALTKVTEAKSYFDDLFKKVGITQAPVGG